MAIREPAYTRLLSIHTNAQAGHFTLPPEVNQAKQTLESIEKAGTAHNLKDTEEAHAELVTGILAAAKNKNPRWPTADSVVKARQDAETSKAWNAAVLEAETRATYHFIDTIAGNADAIIENHLRIALAEVLADGEEIKDIYTEAVKLTAHQLLDSPDQLRRGYTQARHLATRYGAIRDAQYKLSQGRVKHDTDDIFAEFTNEQELYGKQWAVRRQLQLEYFPADPVARFMHIITSPAEPWMPLPSERDEAWVDTFGDAMAIARQTREMHDGAVGVDLMALASDLQ